MKRVFGWLLILILLAAGGLALWRKFAGPIEVSGGELRDGRRVKLRAPGTTKPPAPPAAAALPAKAVEAMELDGGPVDPLVTPGAKAVVLLFIRGDCPISNKYAPEVNRLVARWEERGVAFFLVYVDRDQDAAAVRDHVRDYGYACRVLLDRRHELVDLVGAENTPEAAVFGADRRLAYVGRIDDRFADLGVERAEPTSRELDDALTAVLAGRAPAVAKAPSVGCRIDDLR